MLFMAQDLLTAPTTETKKAMKKAMKTMKTVKTEGVILEVAEARCGGRDNLERAIEKGLVVKKGNMFILKVHKVITV